MRILYCCLQLPWPLDNGQKIVCFNDLKYLSTRFEVDVISYIDPINLSRKDEYLKVLHEKLPNVNFLDPITHRILIANSLLDKLRYYIYGLVKTIPFVVSKYRNAQYLQLLKNTYNAKSHEFVYIESLASSYILDELKRIKKSPTKIIYRSYDIFHETVAGYSKELGFRPTGIAAYIDAMICKAYEHRVWMSVDLIFNVTRRLSKIMIDQVPSIDSSKIFYFPVFVEPLHIDSRITNEISAEILYIGTVHYPPNLSGLQWFLKEVWPYVLARHPDARFSIVGRGGEHLLPVDPSVSIHSYVEDIESFYQDATVFVVPLFSGSGIRLKILDAFNHDIPVVSTKVGYEGLEITENRDILVSDQPLEFARHIIYLLDSYEGRQYLIQNAKNFINVNHSPDLASSVLDELALRLNTDDKR
jgi:glycosyltransferase involved in cell wall biosynthesis